MLSLKTAAPTEVAYKCIPHTGCNANSESAEKPINFDYRVVIKVPIKIFRHEHIIKVVLLVSLS